jgi:2-polyprenyl-3-methyl-5-hydroxy-6-metoxy-1,4-benzoquinol methylase
MLRCPDCTLEFCDPLEYSRDRYDRAYAGEGGSDFYVPAVEWLRQAEPELDESRWMLFGAQVEALEWLQANRPGASLLDVGCGPGWFIIRARQLGFKVKAVEVGAAPVALLQARGYDVVCGSLESVPADWTADVVTMFEVLEHLPNPAGFLAQVRRRFPQSTLILSVPSPKRWTKGGKHRDVADYPPNHLTRWNPQSMARALASAGYGNTHIRYSKPSPLETASVSIRGLLRS